MRTAMTKRRKKKVWRKRTPNTRKMRRDMTGGKRGDGNQRRRAIRRPDPRQLYPDLTAVQRQNDLLDALDASLQQTSSPEKEQPPARTAPGRLFECSLTLVEDGNEIERIRRKPELSSAVIMMLTSAGHRGDGARCQALGVAAYLLKPIRQSESNCGPGPAAAHRLGPLADRTPFGIMTNSLESLGLLNKGGSP